MDAENTGNLLILIKLGKIHNAMSIVPGRGSPLRRSFLHALLTGGKTVTGSPWPRMITGNQKPIVKRSRGTFKVNKAPSLLDDRKYGR